MEFRDPTEAAKFIDAAGDLTVVGANQKSGGGDVTHVFKNSHFAQTGGEMQGGRNTPGMESINFIYGGHTINGVGTT